MDSGQCEHGTSDPFFDESIAVTKLGDAGACRSARSVGRSVAFPAGSFVPNGFIARTVGRNAYAATCRLGMFKKSPAKCIAHRMVTQ